LYIIRKIKIAIFLSKCAAPWLHTYFVVDGILGAETLPAAFATHWVTWWHSSWPSIIWNFRLLFRFTIHLQYSEWLDCSVACSSITTCRKPKTELYKKYRSFSNGHNVPLHSHVPTRTRRTWSLQQGNLERLHQGNRKPTQNIGSIKNEANFKLQTFNKLIRLINKYKGIEISALCWCSSLKTMFFFHLLPQTVYSS